MEEKGVGRTTQFLGDMRNRSYWELNEEAERLKSVETKVYRMQIWQKYKISSTSLLNSNKDDDF